MFRSLYKNLVVTIVFTVNAWWPPTARPSLRTLLVDLQAMARTFGITFLCMEWTLSRLVVVLVGALTWPAVRLTFGVQPIYVAPLRSLETMFLVSATVALSGVLPPRARRILLTPVLQLLMWLTTVVSRWPRWNTRPMFR